MTINNPERQITEKQELSEKEPAIKLFNILELTHIQKEELRQNIENADNWVIICVHPFYIKHQKQGALTKGIDISKHHLKSVMQDEFGERVEAGIKNYLEGKHNFSAPLIVMEDIRYLDDLENTFSHITDSPKGSNVFFMPTQHDNSEPKFSPIQIRDDSSLAGENWRKFVITLKDLKVKRIFLGGLLLGGVFKGEKILNNKTIEDPYVKQRIEKGATQYDYELGWCVGSAARWLTKGGFDIKISNSFAFPKTGADLRYYERTGKTRKKFVKFVQSGPH